MKKKFLEINDVNFQIGGKTKVKNTSFYIENEGETLCILGPSGIGKTTILRTIAGLEKVHKGTIKLNGKLLSSKEKHIEPEHRNISLSFQDNSLFPHYTVEKNISLGAERNKSTKRSIGDSTLKNIHEFAKENNLNLERASIKMLEQNLIKPKAKTGLNLFINYLSK